MSNAPPSPNPLPTTEDDAEKGVTSTDAPTTEGVTHTPSLWEPEYEDGYPTDEWLETIKTISAMPATEAFNAGRRFLLETLPLAVTGISCCQYSSKPIDEPHTAGKEISFITGGWSGAEDLIETALSVYWIRHFYYMWQRGGLHVFRVPAAPLPPPPGQ